MGIGMGLGWRDDSVERWMIMTGLTVMFLFLSYN